MSFLSRVIQFVFWVVVVTWGIRLLRWVFSRGLNETSREVQTRQAPGSPDQARRLVRDPVCGMHVAEVLAIPLREGDETLHFCSAHCRDQYAAGLRKYAANG